MHLLLSAPLVRRVSAPLVRHMSLMMRKLIHLFGLSSSLTCIHSAFQFPLLKFITSSFGSQFQFLTIIGLILSAIVFLLSLFEDLSPLIKTIKKDVLILTFPVEGVITLVYWTFMTINPGLLHPNPALRIPLLLDIVIHLITL